MKPIKIIVPVSIECPPLHGEITYLACNDISVKLISPYSGVSSGLHIPYFAMHYAVMNDKCFANPDGNVSEHGWETAEHLLKDLYDCCVLFHRHRDEIEKEYALFQKSVKALDKNFLSDELYREKKRELRRQLRANEIDLKNYEKTLWELRKQNKKYSDEVFCVQKGFEDTVQRICCTKHYIPVMELVKAFIKY